MAKNKKQPAIHQHPQTERFSPKAIFNMKQKETELLLESHSYCKDPYKDLDYCHFIYMQILEAFNKQFGGKYKPIKIFESTITESSDYIGIATCVLFPVMFNNEMFVFLENKDLGKATYGFKIHKKSFFKVVESLKSFFSSGIANKRSRFTNYIPTIVGIISFRKIVHTTSKVYEQRIKQFLHMFPYNIH